MTSRSLRIVVEAPNSEAISESVFRLASISCEGRPTKYKQAMNGIVRSFQAIPKLRLFFIIFTLQCFNVLFRLLRSG